MTHINWHNKINNTSNKRGRDMKYAVIDLEMCRVPKERKTKDFYWSHELIQIGAVLLNESYEVVETFETYVKPEFGYIDSFIKKLTGISKGDVLGAPNAKEALEQFLKWVPDDAIIVSWSDSDSAQIRHEMQGKKFTFPKLEKLLEESVDSQAMFTEVVEGDRAYNLREALMLSDIDYDEKEHEALADAYNTALLFAKMKKEPIFKFNPYYMSVQEECSMVNTPFAELFEKINFAISV